VTLGTTLSRASCAMLGVGTLASVAIAQTAPAPKASAPRVTIVSPQNGSFLTGPSVHVVVAAQGIEIAPAAEHRVGTAHHHLFLDADVTSPDVPIPGGLAGIVHLGKGQSEYTFDNVSSGSHRLIDVLADPDHVPLKPMVADTVQFTVQ
jgi:hypothetical protein